MRLLIANDDGLESPALWTLVAALKGQHDVVVATPAFEQSGTGHAFTFRKTLQVARKDRGDVRVFVVDGFPSDCVKFALCHLGLSSFDLVLSGINPGDNAGVCEPYSGTLACAREAALFGIPAIALSSLECEPGHYQAIANWTARLLESPLPPFPRGVYWNVNFPKTAPAGWKDLRVCRASSAMFQDRYEEVAPGTWQLVGYKNPAGIEPGTDDAWLALGHPALVPLRIDSTHPELAEKLDHPFPAFSE